MTFTDTAEPVNGPTAARLKRPSWRDPRLLVGLVLLLTAVALGARVVALADRTEPFYAARGDLATGTPLASDALIVVRLRLTGTEAGYLDAGRPLPAGQVLIRPVGAGEVVPLTSIAPADKLRVRPVGIPIDGDPPSGLGPGALVDIWASAKRRDAEGGGYEEAERIADTVEVSDVRRPGEGLSASRTGSVEVLLGEELAPVLDALANQARVVVLPIPGSLTRGEKTR